MQDHCAFTKVHPQNKTTEDAILRTCISRIGSLVEPSLDYLYTLRNILLCWLLEIEKEIEELESKV